MELWVWWAAALLLALVAPPASGSQRDFLDLLQFKENVEDKEGSLVTWVSAEDSDPCLWQGISCASTLVCPPTGTITCQAMPIEVVRSIDLRGLGLSGIIDTAVASLANISSLDHLDLSDNAFTGQFPDFSQFKSLEVLKLGNNQLSGSLTSLNLPPSLVSLDVQRNLLKGSLNLTDSSEIRLETCILQGNQFTGPLPLDLADLFDLSVRPNRTGILTTFDASGNQLQGSIPPRLGAVITGKFDISQNKFSGNIPDEPWRCQYVDLSGNELTGAVPPRLLVNKTYVNVSGNELSGSIDLTDVGWGAPSRYIDLSNNMLWGPVPPELGSSALEILWLQNNLFIGGLSDFLQRNLSSVRELRFGGNWLSLGKDFFSLPLEFPKLEVLDLAGCGLDGRVLLRAEKMKHLRVLDLSDNSLTGKVPAVWSSLRELHLVRNRFSRYGEGNFDLEGLQVLDLSYNGLSLSNGIIRDTLQNGQNLKELRFGSNNSTSGVGLDLFWNLRHNLEILDLSNLNVYGELVRKYDFSSLPSLRILNLSRNFIAGSLPPVLETMPSLIELDVSFNYLKGEVPSLFPYSNATLLAENPELCGHPLPSCAKDSAMELWKIILVVVASVFFSGGICLLLGSLWRKSVDSKRRQQDIELIAALLDRDSTSLMSLRELQRATKGFSKEHEIGEGGFGTVYRGTLDDGTKVAIKRSKRDASSSEEKHQFLNEVKILTQIRHANLVRLLGCCLAINNALLVFEFVPNGTLQDHLLQKSLTWAQRLIIAIQTAGALDYLHSAATAPIYHLDIKSANILLDQAMNAKVADFGISKLAPAVDATHITILNDLRGTFGYMDPELMQRSTYTEKSDVYAFGVVLLELITAKPVIDRSRGENVNLVKWTEGLARVQRLAEVVDPALRETYESSDEKEAIEAVHRVARMCLELRSEGRPSAKEVMRDLLLIQRKGGVLTEPLAAKTFPLRLAWERIHGLNQPARPNSG